MSSQQISPGGYNLLPPVVKNLLIINGLFYLGTYAFATLGIDLVKLLGLFVPQSEFFQPHQLVSYIFMHGSIDHIFFNMFALWMFGNTLENYWGGKRFLIYYMLTGLGAGLIHLGVLEAQYFSVINQIPEEAVHLIKEEGLQIMETGKQFKEDSWNTLNHVLNIPTVGASGAVFGLLLAFGMMFPNAQIYLYFLFPIRAKYFVIGYGLLELFSGVSNRPGDNVAHFAHLGGMLIGFILIKYWQRHRTRF
jgi:membrane associated rhomboid family serine protease